MGRLLLVLALSIAGTDALAAQRRFWTDAELRQEYTDNQFFSRSEAQTDLLTTVSVGARGECRTERSHARITGRIGGLIHADNSELNAVDQECRATVSHQLSPRWNLSANSAYIRDHRPDRDLETNGLIYSASERSRFQAGFSGSYSFSEIMTGAFQYGFMDDQYADPEFSDTRSHSLSTGLIRDLSRHVLNLSGRIHAGHDRYRYPRTRYDNYWLTVGAVYLLDECWRVLMDLGGRYTRGETETTRLSPVIGEDESGNPVLIGFEEVSQTQRFGTTGATGTLRLSYQGLYDTMHLELTHGLYAASGQGESSNRSSIAYRYHRRLAADFGIDFSAGYYIHRSDSGVSKTESDATLRLASGLWYDFTDDLRGVAGYQYTRLDEENGHRDRSKLYLMIRGQHEWGE